ncbi:MAG TPA: chemotaxis protein CheX [Alkalispirochaeta sp.]|nr:chemotaxis protein CheX [Alkalispirochaeta sp.]
MSQKTVSSFTRALKAVFEESGVSSLQVGEIVPRESSTAPSQTFQVSVSVGIAGGIKGYMFLQLDTTTASALAQELSRSLGVPLDDPEEFGSMHRAALAELANQISGRATMYLSEAGVDARITPPSVMTGSGITLAVADGLRFYDTAVAGPGGTFALVVGLQES